jgi:putative nucleotidyltransferase with HDIG domain
MKDYLPINSSSIKTDTQVGCDLYLHVKSNANNRYVLYCRGEAVFGEDISRMLWEKNISNLFIKKEDLHTYSEYLENNFHEIITDTRIPTDERSKIIHRAATNLVKDLFNDPRAGNIERTKTFAYNMVDYILQEGRAARSLLQIAIHEHYTYTHSVNVAAMGTLFANELGFKDENLKHFCSGILLHDIGKTRISTDIINKKDKLTKEEFDEMKKHPEMGIEILRESGDRLTEEYSITLQHHENYDGTGYPRGLKGDEILRSGKIARIIDVYDALTTERPYSKTMRPFAALVEMKEKMLHCFDKELFVEFVRFSGPYDPRKRPRSNDNLRP